MPSRKDSTVVVEVGELVTAISRMSATLIMSLANFWMANWWAESTSFRVRFRRFSMSAKARRYESWRVAKRSSVLAVAAGSVGCLLAAASSE